MKKLPAAILLTCIAACGQAQTTTDMKMLIGREAVVQRIPFYQPGTYQMIPNTYAGQTVTIIDVKPSAMFASIPRLTAGQMASLPPQSRENIENVRNAAILVVQFADGTKADTGPMPVMPSNLSSYLEVIGHPAASSLAVVASVAATATNPSASLGQAQTATKQDCPLKLTKIKYAGFGTGLAAAMLGMTNQYVPTEAYEIHVTNQSDKETRVIEIITQFFNPMGDVAYTSDGDLVQTKLKPGKSTITLGTTPLGILTSNAPSMRAWVTRIKFKDGSFWTDDGSQSCAIESTKA
jgi:hypothetical protein